MRLTKAMLLERIKELEKARESALGQVNAINGAIQDCQQWLTQLSKKG